MLRTKGFLTGFYELVKTVLIVFIAAFVIRQFLIQSFRVEGSSMEPNFHNRELVLVEKVSYRFGAPRRGDVVVFSDPHQGNIDLIKRIVGLPGEAVSIHGNKVFINNEPLDESYLKINELTQVNGSQAESFTADLVQDEYFVLGDNRQSSKDSRVIGKIPKRNFIGKVSIIIWPLDDFGAASKPNPTRY